MKTTELLEIWGIDLGELARYLREQVGDVSLVIGGSLADDLGGTWSDIDIYAFGRVSIGPDFERQEELEFSTGIVRRAFGHLHGADLDLQVYDPAALVGLGSRLHSLLDPSTLRSLPAIPLAVIPGLHALSNGLPLNDRDLDRLRTESGADVLRLWLSVRSLTALRAQVADSTDMVRAGEVLGTISQMRLAAESAIDALLSVAGYFHPNPKWRLSLALRGATEGAIPLSHAETVGALFPDALRPRGSISVLRHAIGRCVATLTTEPVLRDFPEVGDLGDTWRHLGLALRDLSIPETLAQRTDAPRRGRPEKARVQPRSHGELLP